MKASEIRNQFFDFFASKGHTRVRSTPLIPKDDPTLLFINAGMNQFKGIFLGKEKSDHFRLMSSQKCIRVSGKHNDLEEVGYDTYHHTFFEMLGNWSFGDYYKAEAIEWAWELFTGIWGLEKNRLWVTVYQEDHEAEKLWRQITDISAERVLRFGKKDNFWEMGETGPCGPCSEIHYFVGEDLSDQKAEGVNASNEYLELWNLVFIQNNRNGDGTLDELPNKHVDTGAGLERIASVLQRKSSNYETDLFQPIIKAQESLLGVNYGDNLVAHRAISDHIRMLTFAIADGVLPSNEGRGYVARRILRRAARFGRSMGKEDPFLTKLVSTVVDVMGEIYPEVSEKQAHVENVIEAEEVSFNETLNRGLSQFERITADLSGITISGEDAFRLYDTFGFPIDLTVQIAREKGLQVNTEDFNLAMAKQREKGRKEGKFKIEDEREAWTNLSEGEDSKFVGYDETSIEASVRRFHIEKDTVVVVLDKTPFYGEQGGQVGDVGIISGDNFELSINETIKDGKSHLHIGNFSKGNNILSPSVRATINSEIRGHIRKNHTATHLLHKALKMVLGDHVQQAGSLVHPDYLRFDLTHFQKITHDELNTIEKIVNEQIQLNSIIDIKVTSFEESKKEGAEAIFEEKYGAKVRVITIDSFSKELCGGTHVQRTGEIGFFKITEESALASGVRRLVAITGPASVDHIIQGFKSIDHIKALLNCRLSELVDRTQTLVNQRNNLEKEIKKYHYADSSYKLSEFVKSAKEVNGIKVLIDRMEATDLEHLKLMGDELRKILLNNGLGVLYAVFKDQASIVCVVTDDLINKGIQANEIAQLIGKEIGGGGGGKPHLATAGGRDSIELDEILKKVAEIVSGQLEGGP